MRIRRFVCSDWDWMGYGIRCTQNIGVATVLKIVKDPSPFLLGEFREQGDQTAVGGAKSSVCTAGQRNPPGYTKKVKVKLIR